MRPASHQSFADTHRPPLRRRATALLLVLGVANLGAAVFFHRRLPDPDAAAPVVHPEDAVVPAGE